MKHILMVEDDGNTRDWFSQLLSEAFGRATIIEADSLEQANRILKDQPINLAVVDIYLPDGRGSDFIRHIKSVHPDLFCVVVTAYDDSADIFSALKAGADGYLLKSQDKQRLVRSLKEMMEGAPPLSPSIARRIIKHFNVRKKQNPLQAPKGLTQRETQVLTHIAQGMTRNETAEELGIRPGTVAGYIKRAYAKLNITSRAQAALKAQELGLV